MFGFGISLDIWYHLEAGLRAGRITTCDSYLLLEKLFDIIRSGQMKSFQKFFIRWFFSWSYFNYYIKVTCENFSLLTSNFQLTQWCLASLRDHCLIQCPVQVVLQSKSAIKLGRDRKSRSQSNRSQKYTRVAFGIEENCYQMWPTHPNYSHQWVMPLYNPLPLNLGRTCALLPTNRIWQMWQDTIAMIMLHCIRWSK